MVEFQKEDGLAVILTAMRKYKRDMCVQICGSCVIMNFLVRLEGRQAWVEELWEQGIVAMILEAIDSTMLARKSGTVFQSVPDDTGTGLTSVMSGREVTQFLKSSFKFIVNMYTLPFARPRPEPKISIVLHAMARYLQDVDIGLRSCLRRTC